MVEMISGCPHSTRSGPERAFHRGDRILNRERRDPGKKRIKYSAPDHAERACSRTVRPAMMVIAIVVILIVAAAEMARRDKIISLVQFARATVISFFGNFI
jgi:hypothetical protein